MKLKVALAILAFCAVASAQSQQVRKMAVTIDDLPFVGVEPNALADAQRRTKKILSALKAGRVPAVGFVNEGQLEVAGEVEARTDLLRQWVKAGMILGNHTYSHPDFNQKTIEEFENEIVKGEVVTRRLMRSKRPYQLYFRHPMTHTGDTVEKKEAIERFLARRGYRVTPHTIDSMDYVFTTVYVLALRSNDQPMAQKVRQAYLDFTVAATEFAEKFSQQIFGREIPQTLMIHANDVTADCLDELLKRLAARGYRFVSLDEAMKDPAYQTKDTLISRHGPTWLWRWMASKGMRLSAKGDPDPPEWIMKKWAAAQ